MTNSIRPLIRQAGYTRRRDSLRVEQPIPSISVRLAPLPQVFRHFTRCWPSIDIEIPGEATEEGDAVEHRRGRVLTALAYALKDIDHNHVQGILLEGHGREAIDPSWSCRVDPRPGGRNKATGAVAAAGT